jgi:hypothetical protein
MWLVYAILGGYPVFCRAYQRKKYFYYDPSAKYSKIAPDEVETCLLIYQKTRLKGFGRGRKA